MYLNKMNKPTCSHHKSTHFRTGTYRNRNPNKGLPSEKKKKESNNGHLWALKLKYLTFSASFDSIF